MSWGLGNFMNSSKKNTNSPANHSPLKSPNSVHSDPPSVNNKDDSVAQTPDSSRSRSLKDIGPSETMPFDPGVTRDSVVDSDDNQADRESKENESDKLDNDEGDDDSDDEDDNRVRKKKKRKKVVSEQEVGMKLPSSSSIPHATCKQSGSTSGEKSELKTHKSHESLLGKEKDPAHRPAGLKVSSTTLTSSEKLRHQHPSSSFSSKSSAVTPVKTTESSHKRKKSSKAASLSDVEIDVVSITPDAKGRQRLSPSPEEDASEDRGKQEASKRLFDNHPSNDSSDESDSKLSVSRGKSIHIHDSKRHRRKHSLSSSPTPNSSLPPNSHTAQTTAEKISKKFPSDSDAVTLEHLKSMAKPPNLLSPISSVFPSPPGVFSSKEKLPSFEKSFSPAPHPGGSLETSSLLSSPRPSIIISKQNHDGTSQPQMKVQVPFWCLPERSLTWLREKKRKSRRANSSSVDVEKIKEEMPSREKSPHNSSLPSSSSGQQHEPKNSRVPPFPDSKLSSPSSGKQSSASNDIPHQKAFISTSTSSESASSTSASKSEKRKLSDSNGLGHSASSYSSSSQYKIPKTSKNPKRESQGSSNQSPASGSSEKSSFTKSNKLRTASPDLNKSAGSSGAVKNLDFASKGHDHSVVANGTPSSNSTSTPNSESRQSKSSKRKASAKDEVPNKKNKTDISV